LSQGSFWRSRVASEALGILLLLTGLLAALALASYDPKDPNLFSLTTGEAASPQNWIGGFGASLSAALYALVGFAAWAIPVVLVFAGWRRFWQRPIENPGSKASGLALLFLAVPTLLSLTLGRRIFFGEEAEAGGIVGRAVAQAARGRLGTAGAVLLAATALLLAIPLATQVSLGDVFLGLRVRLIGLWSRWNVGWVRRRDQKTKERLRRTVVAKHLEKARQEGVTLDEVPFTAEEPRPVLREVPGPGKFSLTRASSAAPAPAPKRQSGPAPKKKADPQQALPLIVEGYAYPPVSLLERRENAGAIDRKLLAETGRVIAAKCAEFGVEGEVTEYHPGPVVTT
jgi:DNA segregation ATPase FtsK/SpoIIIE, S-DNA-T family